MLCPSVCKLLAKYTSSLIEQSKWIICFTYGCTTWLTMMKESAKVTAGGRPQVNSEMNYHKSARSSWAKTSQKWSSPHDEASALANKFSGFAFRRPLMPWSVVCRINLYLYLTFNKKACRRQYETSLYQRASLKQLSYKISILRVEQPMGKSFVSRRL